MLFSLAYVICFSVLLYGAFNLMRQGFTANTPASPRRKNHPEAPQPGEPLLYLDLNRERLEAIYNKAS